MVERVVEVKGGLGGSFLRLRSISFVVSNICKSLGLQKYLNIVILG